MKITLAIAALAGIASVANAGVTINEVLGNPVGSDFEFIELFNTTGAAIDLTGWSIELWDSDDGNVGGPDAGAPYGLSGSIAAGGYFTLGNTAAQNTLGFTADQLFGSNAIENSSYTMVLRDAALNVVETIFVVDGDGDINDGGLDIANIAGTPITPDFIAIQSSGFLPAGFYRLGDVLLSLATWISLMSPQPRLQALPTSQPQVPSRSSASVVWQPLVVAANRDDCCLIHQAV